MFLAIHNVNAKAVGELKPEEIREIVGESVSVSKTLSERMELNSDGICVICEEIKNKIEKNFIEKNIEVTEDIEIDVRDMNDSGIINVNDVLVSIDVMEEGFLKDSLFSEFVKVHHAKEDGYNEENENYVLNKVKNIEYDFIQGTEFGIEKYFLVENLGKSDNNIGEQVVLRKVKEQLNDDSIKVEYREKLCVHCGKNEKPVYIFFYKDNVLYDVEQIEIASYYKYQTSSEGIHFVLTRETIFPDMPEFYQNMQRELNARGYENIIEWYIFMAWRDDGELKQNVFSPIILHVDPDYNNQKVKILYFDLDFGTTYDEVEEFDDIVESGAINVQIPEEKISYNGYFLIALDNEVQTNNANQEENNEIQANDVSQKEEIENPQTGSFISFLVIVGGIVLAVVIFIISHKNKKLYKI